MTSPDDSTPTSPREPRPADADRPGAARPVPESTTDGGTAPRGSAPESPAQAPGRAAEPDSRTAPSPTGRQAEKGGSREQVAEVPTSGARTAGVWIALVLGAIVLILLLVFILQNNTSTVFHYFTGQFSLPLGVAMLLAAIAGALVMALVGSVRMFQQSRTIKRLRKQQEKIQHMLDS
jgi:uncharacterized integral membrane protein